MEVSGQIHAPAVPPPIPRERAPGTHFMPRPLYLQGKSPCYSLDRRLGVPQSRSGHGVEEKNSQPVPGLELPIIQSVGQIYATEISRFSE
jgi:hypothetical protein